MLRTGFDTDRVLEDAARGRESALLALSLAVGARAPEEARASGFAAAMERFSALPAAPRRALLDHPVFRTWFCRFAALHAEAAAPEAAAVQRPHRLAQFSRLVADLAETGPARGEPRIPGTSIEARRFDVDPLIVEAAAKHLPLPDAARQRELEKTREPFGEFLARVRDALARIGEVWPDAGRDFPRFVRLIVQAPGCGSRSCSGSGFPGVVFIGDTDVALVQIEESLVHEYMHQVLITACESRPVIDREPGEIFRLPWSGKPRDLYGYLHAFYVYITLVKYLEALRDRSEHEQAWIAERIRHIRRSLPTAVRELRAAAPRFTAWGHALFEELVEDVRGLDCREI